MVCLDARVPSCDTWRKISHRQYCGAIRGPDRRSCPSAGACRGNSGVCDDCEAALLRCVICRMPLAPLPPAQQDPRDVRNYCFGMQLCVLATLSSLFVIHPADVLQTEDVNTLD